MLAVLTLPWAYAAKSESKGLNTPSARSGSATASQTSRSRMQAISKDPYLGAIVIDANTGKVLFEDNADAKGYPASIVKLMDLLILLEAIESKRLHLQDPVTVTAEASRIGGSQVFLKENEMFPVEELLYAVIVQSANDAATALSLHYAGSKEAFVEVMNKRAREIGMKDTVFHSVHGLPPGKEQLPDVSTPRDLARLCRELLKHPETLLYTATRERPFRTDATEPLVMRSHNHLLKTMEGCDGLKTGYFRQAGFSIAATAKKKGVRAIAVVLGSADRKVRDAKAREILSKGLLELVATALPPTPSPVVQPGKTETQTKDEVKTKPEEKKSDVIQIRKSTIFIMVAIIAAIIVLLIIFFVIRRKRSDDIYIR
ncbi:MAG: D-alanyl-D-alanine carboxypeptidase [Desulfobacterales bacterium]|nr:D-alanyl-D-alanine carboxypeptidase [Desulfobacterales bacterium]MBL7172684.1 D-alanyl-D-alanine carboxypeptidase [Desulfobacteraceae bacterium]MBL7226349.1 D-alanyl-D-alanine carboxypeptidase [Desulfobacteraceae bacterium]